MKRDTTPTGPALLEVYQVARRLHCGPECVRRLLRRRQLAGIRIDTMWRVDPIDLQVFIDQRRINVVRASA